MRITLSRVVVFLLLFAQLVAAQGFPPASRVDEWMSPHNRKRLRLNWDVLPDTTPIKLPDGTTEPRKAPWPFLVYVVQVVESKANKKLQEKAFKDTRLAVANHAIHLIKLKPHRAVDVPYLASVQGIKDPTLIAVDRNFKIVGMLKSPKDFNDKKVLGLMAKLAKIDYETPLGPYVKSYVKLLQKEEKLHKTEKKIEKLQEKAAKKDKAAAAKLDKEADEMEAKLADDRGALEEEFRKLRASLAMRGEEKEEMPTTVGTGKKKRKLTPEELEAIAVYREFAKDDNGIVRAAAVEDLGNIDSAVMVQVILKAANDIDHRVGEAAGKALGRMKKDESLEAMAAGLSHKNSKARTAALLGFANTKAKYPAATPAILKLIAQGDDITRLAAVRALANQGPHEGIPALIAALDDSLPAIRVVAAQALGDLRAKEAAPPLIARIDASDWSLQKASIEALGKLRVKDSIEPLLKKFENGDGLVIESVYRALVSITGQDFKYRAVSWRKWWDRWGRDFKIPTDAAIATAKAKAAKSLEGYAKPKRKYHKIETLSRKMIFIIDISTSMRDKIVIPPDAPESVRKEYPSRVKMDIAKRELIELLATLDQNVYFNIISFAGKAKPWRDGLVSGSNKNAAIKFVKRLKPLEPAAARGGGGGRTRPGGGAGGGGKAAGSASAARQKTNTYAALMEAFGLADKKVPDWKARTKVDTIFLVTDGLPTTGEIVDVRKLVIAINEVNRTRGIVIHIICFDKEAIRRLKPLAEQSGGQAVLRGF
ncbi:MAG: HEAT repeat domain-containing protein [Planctomycetota bacterium]|jgi:HEAT repeat protein